MKVGAVILAAGASTRLGQPKQLAVLAGEPLLERAARMALDAGCDPVVIVLGSSASAIIANCRLDRCTILMNPDWAEGMASSMRRGIHSLASDCDAAILMTCDQPAVTADHLRELMKLCTDTPVASFYDGRRGVPACFPAGHFDELQLLRGDEGARRLLESALTVDLARGELDIDTPLALDSAKSVYR